MFGSVAHAELAKGLFFMIQRSYIRMLVAKFLFFKHMDEIAQESPRSSSNQALKK